MADLEKIIVTGASGQLGSLVVEELLSRGVTQIVATTREPDKLANLRSRGVEVRPCDFKDPAGLPSAFAGGTRLFLISTKDIGSRTTEHEAAILAARAAGIRHVIYTSWPDARHSVSAGANEHAATEDFIVQCGLLYTILENYPYSENLISTLPKAIQSGSLYGSSGEGRTAYVARKDCARAAAAVLQHATDYENKRFRISGSAAFSCAELMALVSGLLGRTLTYVDLSPKDYETMLIEEGMPEAFADMVLTFESALKGGEVATVSQAVQELTGEPPEPLETFLKRALADGRIPINDAMIVEKR